MRSSRSVKAAIAAAVVVAGLSGCNVPPRVPFTVNTTSAGADHTPGDGVCEVTPGQGDCSLPAAVTEAGAVPRATITVPAGEYRGMHLVATGDVLLNWNAPADVQLADWSLTVSAGASFRATGLRTAVDDGDWTREASITVAGTLELVRSELVQVDGTELTGTALIVLAGATALVTATALTGGTHAIDNAGTALVDRSTILSLASSRVNTTGAGQSYLRATVVSRAVNTSAVTAGCSGTAPTSVGYSYYAPFAFGCTPLAATDISSTPAPIVSTPDIGKTFAGVDAIPVGDPACESGTVDLYGNPRGIDGNDDGIGGCDIGAVEHQPALPV